MGVKCVGVLTNLPGGGNTKEFHLCSQGLCTESNGCYNRNQGTNMPGPPGGMNHDVGILHK